MMRRRVSFSLAGLVLVAITGCDGQKAATGHLEASWIGADHGKATLPAQAVWCPRLALLEVTAVAGDTGIAIGLYVPDTMVPGPYPVARGAPPPGAGPTAGVASRWFADVAVRGYQGDSGLVTVQRKGQGWAGRFSLRMRPIGGEATVDLSGDFEVPVVDTTAAACPTDSLRPVHDSGGR
jgi:hypothetical protein